LFPVYLIEIPSAERIDSASFSQVNLPVLSSIFNHPGLLPSMLHVLTTSFIGVPYLSMAVKLACHGVPVLPLNAATPLTGEPFKQICASPVTGVLSLLRVNASLTETGA
jgi:hypothetical protein